MFEYEFATRKRLIRFWVDGEGFAILSPATKAYIAEHATSVGDTYRIPRALWEELDRLRRADATCAYNKRRSAVRKKLIDDASGTYARADIAELWRLQSGECYFCGAALKPVTERDPFHIDHLSSLNSGGSQWPSNLALLCRLCNQEKHTKSERAYWRIVEARIGIELASHYLERARLNRRHKRALRDTGRKAENARLKLTR
jgi:5-methylcytosine-specific restriction endonuclease McrA